MIIKRQLEVFKVPYIQIRHITDTLSRLYYIWYLPTIPGRIVPRILQRDQRSPKANFVHLRWCVTN